jgi:hypothetical protein
LTALSGTNELFVTPNLQYFTEGEESGQPISWMIEINGEIYDSGFGINSNTMTYIEDYLAENPDLGISANFENNKLHIFNTEGNPKSVRLIPNRVYVRSMELAGNSTAKIDSSGVISFNLAPVAPEEHFVISCTPPEGQQRIVLNKVRNTLPFLTFSNVVFDIYIDGTPAASGVSLLDAAVMDLHGLKVEDLTGSGRAISITPTSGKHKAFELMPTMGSFADDTDIEEGHVVVEKGSFHFCLAAAANDLPVTLEWKIEGDGTLYSDRVENVIESSKRSLNITELRTYNGLEIISAQAFYQNKITSLTIADTVWLIGQNSFAKNQITELVLGSGLKMLGNYAFKDNAISAVTVHAVIPPEFESDSWLPFDGNPIASIRVPAESVSAYKAAEGWSDFSSIITAI